MSKPTPSETILAFVSVSLLVFVFFESVFFLYVALTCGLIGLLSKRLSLWIHQAWSFVQKKLGNLLARLLLFLVYFVVLCPLSFFYRRFNKESSFHNSGEKESAYRLRNHTYTTKDLENPW